MLKTSGVITPIRLSRVWSVPTLTAKPSGRCTRLASIHSQILGGILKPKPNCSGVKTVCCGAICSRLLGQARKAGVTQKAANLLPQILAHTPKNSRISLEMLSKTNGLMPNLGTANATARSAWACATVKAAS